MFSLKIGSCATVTRVLRQAGLRANLELCASIQVQCRLTVLCSENPQERKARERWQQAKKAQLK